MRPCSVTTKPVEPLKGVFLTSETASAYAAVSVKQGDWCQNSIYKEDFHAARCPAPTGMPHCTEHLLKGLRMA